MIGAGEEAGSEGSLRAGMESWVDGRFKINIISFSNHIFRV